MQKTGRGFGDLRAIRTFETVNQEDGQAAGKYWQDGHDAEAARARADAADKRAAAIAGEFAYDVEATDNGQAYVTIRESP